MFRSIYRLRSALVGFMIITSGTIYAADPYPSQPIKMLVGTPAGGTTDVIARMIASSMSKTLGQQIVVDNRPGASGLIAAESVAKAQGDGYTLLMASSQLSTYTALYPANNFEAERDLDPVGLVATSPYVMVVHPSLPVNTFQELIAYAKSNPGEISYAGSAPGTAQHLGWEIIKKKTGVDMRYIPYKGTAALMPDLLAGRLQAGIDNIAILTPYIKNGQLRGIAVTGPKQSPLLPALPTIRASGVPDFVAMGWFGVFSSPRTNSLALSKLKSAVLTAMTTPEIRKKLAEMGSEPQSGSSNELQVLLKQEISTWSKVIKDSGVTVQ